jgi:glutamate-ammonia-ligase adenylyltransferase
VQVQSLFLAQPKLFELMVQVMAFAPRLATALARRPAALDAMLDPASSQPIEAPRRAALIEAGRSPAPGFEAAMDAVRRLHREQAFRIGVQVMSGLPAPPRPGKAFADLADACIAAWRRAALAEVERQGGAFPGEVAVVALGKCGSREMTAGSDLDLMTLYRPAERRRGLGGKGWAAETFYARFTQRLIAALSAPTGEGGLYEVDMRLRPSGTQGPGGGQPRGVRALLRPRGGDLGVPGPDPRAGGLGQPRRPSPRRRRRHRAALRQPRDRRRDRRGTCARCAP